MTIIKYDEKMILKTDRNNISHVIDMFKNVSTSRLVSITHGQDPWINAYNSLDKTIYKKDIKKYFVA